MVFYPFVCWRPKQLVPIGAFVKRETYSCFLLQPITPWNQAKPLALPRRSRSHWLVSPASSSYFAVNQFMNGRQSTNFGYGFCSAILFCRWVFACWECFY